MWLLAELSALQAVCVTLAGQTPDVQAGSSGPEAEEASVSVLLYHLYSEVCIFAFGS